MLRKFFKLFAFGLIIQQLVRLLLLLDIFRHVWNHSPGPCHEIAGITTGAEDIVTIHSHSLSIISSGMRYYHYFNHTNYANVKGRLYIYDWKTDKAEELTLPKPLNRDTFIPHGLSHWSKTPGDDEIVLFVVNHEGQESKVEKMTLNLLSRRLTHVKTIKSEDFRLLNDLVATGPNSFYFTNYYHTRRSYALALLETVSLYYGASIGYLEIEPKGAGQSSRLVHTHAAGMNGIQISPNNKYAYVVSSRSRTIEVFEIDRSTHNLTHSHSVEVHSLCDNIEMDAATGNIWVGCHPVGHQIVRHMEDPTVLSGSQILLLNVDHNSGQVSNIWEIYSNDGRQLSASSVASHHEGDILIGSLATKLLRCQLLVSY